MHAAFKETQNNKIIKILDDMNKNIQYLSLNNTTLTEVNNEGMNKD
jgi:hypothetical protein